MMSHSDPDATGPAIAKAFLLGLLLAAPLWLAGCALVVWVVGLAWS